MRALRAACRSSAIRAGRALIALAALVASLQTMGGADFARLLELARIRFGGEGVSAVTAWQMLVAETAGREEGEKLARVNEFFNRRLRFEDDQEIWRQADYWATPLESLGRGAGDCEDFSIAKYVTLEMLGVAPAKMRLIYVRARIGGATSRVEQAHMVLGFYATPNAEPLVLDNLIGEIRPASRRSDLFPIFSFNGQGLWVGAAKTSSADPTERLSRWRDLLARMREDGIDEGNLAAR